MATHRLRRGIVAALVTCVTFACDDVPLLPKWDADWYVPLPSRAIALLGPFPAVIPVSPVTANVSFPPQSEQLDDAVGGILEQDLRSAELILTLSSTIPLSGNDTVFVAASAAELTNPAAPRIVVPITLLAGVPTLTDTVAVSAAGLGMLRASAANNGALHVQLRGSVTYSGPAPRTVTANDSIGVRLALLARIAVSR